MWVTVVEKDNCMEHEDGETERRRNGEREKQRNLRITLHALRITHHALRITLYALRGDAP
ncbi:hypothetical protein Q2T83_07830 [Fervidibacter sacchari]|uniref:Transposase DDE domain-containing protein n=1 Tax=Candidatus Fervidibacter sacchari TaxID=1448929 RepID=A0ABT2EKP4_9BACT|nr:hypothetical protein [Candidatus Fervidibacter sacchari]MCS3918515.1 hypothetical protein [Candidatus Fervidibacter sacchari]WKU17718.1 hypothetical protein Q2T83_07830 [Candidatus Fervidibacter sacchari]